MSTSTCESQGTQNERYVLRIETTQGNITVELYNETPQHRDNMIKLVKEGFYDGIHFHRIIKEFMIQTGDPDTKNYTKGENYGSGGPGYTVPAEFMPNLIHKKGALAAARLGDQMNPEKASSGSQFYIVQGKVYNVEELEQMEKQLTHQQKMSIANSKIYAYFQEKEEQLRAMPEEQFRAHIDSIGQKEYNAAPDFHFTEEIKKVYSSIGGTPFLDNEYTVFGEVTEGLDIVDKIANVETESNDAPVEPIKIKTIKILNEPKNK